ncbi:MAG: hypothetical protein QOG90_1303 [Actinomycetota bacterium]|jgi:Tol biopolymer transport system component
MRADGTDQHQVSPAFTDGESDVLGGWSPDGTLLLFSNRAPQAPCELWTMKRDGSNRHKITHTLYNSEESADWHLGTRPV